MSFQEARDRYLKWCSDRGASAKYPSAQHSREDKYGWMLRDQSGSIAYVTGTGHLLFPDLLTD